MPNNNGNKSQKMIRIHDITGKRFGRLVAVERAEDAIIPKTGKKVPRYKCVCDCGNVKIVRKVSLTSGYTRSCGCLHKEQLGAMRRKHGYCKKERLYGVWLNMRERCYNPNSNRYKNYGDRGITICKEWKDDYVNFRNWCLNNGYAENIRDSGRNNLTIDRIDNDGNYSPDNCRWVTNKENCLNKQNSLTDSERFITCPICGSVFEVKKRNQQQTCSAKCSFALKSIKRCMERDENGRFKEKNKL